MIQFPRVAFAEQRFPRPTFDLSNSNLSHLFQSGLPAKQIQGKRIAVTAGSRGISNMADILKALIQTVRSMGGKPFIIPAMGSHGGGTPEGQLHILADYQIAPEAMGVAIDPSIETVCIGKTGDDIPVHIARSAYEADGVIVVNRIKPHTDFTGEVESGLMKMITVGLGKVDGAQAFHSRTSEYDYEYLVQTIARRTLETGKILCGIAILENAYHETAGIEVIASHQIEEREKELLVRAKELMPSLPVEKADILIIDRIGKDISGVGMDPNITGRRYRVNTHWQETPDITRIVAMDLTEKSAGNAVGIGLADFCSKRLVDKMNKRFTYLNAITSRNTICANIPIYFDTDRETLEQTLASIGTATPESLRLLRIRDTLSLIRIEASEALLPELRNNPTISQLSGLHELPFDTGGNLLPMQLEEAF